MDESCLYQLITTPVKNILQVQKFKRIKWMNPRAPKNKAYVPTLVEHVANVLTHGIGIVPALVGALELIRRSATWTQFISAFVYGTSLIMLFTISTFFHSVHYCHHEGSLKDVLHRCDRAMIYVFIAASYFPWLNVETYQNNTMLTVMRDFIWVLAILGILYQQIFHEKYKMLETIFYLIMGLGPSIAIVPITEYYNILELKLGGLFYIAGIIFFKSDGRIPCAHAIWHLFVGAAALLHYYAIFTHLFTLPEDKNYSSLLGFITGVQDSRSEL